MDTEKVHLDANEIIEAAKKDAERNITYYTVAKAICDMIAGRKWNGKKINRRIATDAQIALEMCLSGVSGQFYVGYDNNYGMYHLVIRYLEQYAIKSKAHRDFKMSMLIAYDTNPIIDAIKVKEHNQCYLLGVGRSEETLSKINAVPQAVKMYNEAIVILTNIKESFSDVYPFSSYFDFKPSEKMED